MLDNKETGKLIQNSWLRFNSNIGALYAMFENIPSFADQIDKAKIKEIVNELAFIFKDKPELVEKDISKYIPSVDDLDVYPDFRKDQSVKEIVLAFQDQEIKDAMLEWEAKKPYRSERLRRLFSSVFNQPPMNGVLIRRSMLVSLVAFLEILLEDIYKSHHLILGETKEGTQKATDKLMRGGWQKRLENLHVIGFGTPIISKYIGEVVEIAQRRNLLVHNDGVVDDDYKARISNKYEVGDHLLVSTKYFQQAIDIFHVMGFVLSYSQLEQYEENRQALYNKLDEFVLDSLGRKRYSLVLELSDNSANLNLPENKKLIVMVNRAIAFRELGQIEEVERIVSILASVEHDWQIDMAISMLVNDISTLKRQIKDAPDVPNIVRISTWPLFDPVRNELWFKTAFAKKSKVQLPRKTGKHGRK
jgi:hypothetical protein